MRGLFVTATDTGVGKTIVSAALIAAIAEAGEPVRAHKPVLTGLDESPQRIGDGSWPADHELLAGAAGMRPEDVAPLRFGPAVSPHLAARLAGGRIDPAALLGAAHSPEAGATLIVEGVGGLLVPLGEDYSVCDLAGDLGLPVLIAARAGLGTINHTLLTLRAARAAGLDVRAVVLTPWPRRPDAIERSNRETIERLGAVEVATLRHVAGPNMDELALAGGELPWRRWLGRVEGPALAAREGHGSVSAAPAQEPAVRIGRPRPLLL
jgi:dethiobiotin synthetase